MKTILSIFIFIFCQPIFGQDAQPNKTFNVTSSNENYFYSEDDARGNMIFSKNVGMNGPITMLSASEYDSLNRVTKSYSAHSNIGFYLTENVYDANTVMSYEYISKTDTSFSFDRAVLNLIKTRKEFIEMDVFVALKNGERQLRNIEYVDASNNIIKEVYISENGDTTGINTHQFNDKNQEIWFHIGTIDSELWTWDIYYEYDEHSNKIKSSRVSSSDGIRDTTEVYRYYYNEDNLLTSETYYYEKTFRNKSEYSYNEKKQVVQVLFYEGEETILDAKTIYTYSKTGDVTKKTIFDYRNKGKERKEVFTFDKED
jgi:hypothetical protein